MLLSQFSLTFLQTQKGMSLYFCANLDGLLDYLRDNPEKDIFKLWYSLYSSGGSKEVQAWIFIHTSYTLQYLSEGILFPKSFEGPLHKKWSLPLKISSVNLTKFAVFLQICSHLLKKSLMENFISCAVVSFMVPIFKNVGEGSATKYSHPINLLSEVSKTFENLVSYKHFDRVGFE